MPADNVAAGLRRDAQWVAAREHPSPVTRIGPYRVHQVIGRGGSSVVYRASNDHRRELPPIVAIKAADDRCGLDVRRQFGEHSRVSATVEHPNVVPVVDSGDDDGRPYLVMPHVAGADLARRLAAGALTVGRVLTVLRQVADGLDALHRAGVLHLDVKPSNILVGSALRAPSRTDRPDHSPGRPAMDDEQAYVTDLGLCRFLTDSPARIDVDRPGGMVLAAGQPHVDRPGADGSGADRDAQPGGENFVGSPRYAAPEHLRGGALQPAADIYSLTCVLFACLAGRPPYVGDIPAIVTGHLSARIPSLAALTGLPRRLDRVIGRGMHPDPGSRFGSCRELLAGARLAISAGIC